MSNTKLSNHLFVASLALSLLGPACSDGGNDGDSGDAGLLGDAGGSGNTAGGTGGTNGTGGTGVIGGTGGTGTMMVDAGETRGTGGMTGGTGGGNTDGGTDGGTDTTVVLPNDGEALSVCQADADCNGDDLKCAIYGFYRGYCTDDCVEPTDCPPIDGIEATCGAQGNCVINCEGSGSGDGDCPENMVCAEIAGVLSSTVYRCQYPEPKDHAEYEACDRLRGDSDCKADLTCDVIGSLPLVSDIALPYCTAGCMQDSDCNDAGAGATPICDFSTPLEVEGKCALQCGNDKDCPGDMLCLTINLGLSAKRCGYRP